MRLSLVDRTAQKLRRALCATLITCALGGTARPARTVCDAALSQIDQVLPSVRSMIRRARTTDGQSLHPEDFNDIPESDYLPSRQIFYVPPEQQIPTQVLRMNLPDKLHRELVADLERITQIQKEVDRIVKHALPGYHPYKVEFDYAGLFVPGCAEFMELNRDLVRNEFKRLPHTWRDRGYVDPTCMCNAFSVAAGAPAEGFHHATAIGYEIVELWDHNRSFAMEHHRSLHTALTPTNRSSSPLVVFDDLPVELASAHLMIATIMRSGWTPVLYPDLIDVARAAFMVFAVDAYPLDHLRVTMVFLTAFYYAARSCPTVDGGSRGTFWELEVGEALYFNNWRMHSDNEVGPRTVDRHTIDLRCTSAGHTPAPFLHEHELLHAMMPSFAEEQDHLTECLLHLLNYSSADEFMATVYSSKRSSQLKPSFVLGNVLFNYMNSGQHSLLHEDQYEGMRRHGAHVRRLYDAASGPGAGVAGLNWTGFAECLSGRRQPTLPTTSTAPAYPTWLLQTKLVIFGIRVVLSAWCWWLASIGVVGIFAVALFCSTRARKRPKAKTKQP